MIRREWTPLTRELQFRQAPAGKIPRPRSGLLRDDRRSSVDQSPAEVEVCAGPADRVKAQMRS